MSVLDVGGVCMLYLFIATKSTLIIHVHFSAIRKRTPPVCAKGDCELKFVLHLQVVSYPKRNRKSPADCAPPDLHDTPGSM